MASEPTTLDSIPTSTPLYRCVVDANTDTTKYLVAYRSVTLLPIPSSRRDDGTTPNASLPTEPYSGTVGIRLSETGSSPNALVSKNVEIHAEDLYIYAGSYFSLRGRNLTITANRIFAVAPAKLSGGSGGGGASSPPTIEFDCSGLPGARYEDRAPNGPLCADCPPQGVSGTDVSVSTTSWTAQPGRPGQDGGKGRPGSHGGRITIAGKLKSLLAAEGGGDGNVGKCSLVLNVLGGPGGPGQDGGFGSNAGNCVEHKDWIPRLVTTEFENPIDPALILTFGRENLETFRTRYGDPISCKDGFPLFQENAMLLAIAGEKTGQKFSAPDYWASWWTKCDIPIAGAYIRSDLSRFICPGGIGGSGGDAGEQGAPGEVRVTGDSDGLFTAAGPPPRHDVVAGGEGGKSGDPGKIMAPQLLGAVDSVSFFGYDEIISSWRDDLLKMKLTLNGNAGRSRDVTSTQPAPQTLDSATAGLQDATQLLMVLQRVRFEYQMGFGAQIYGDSAATDDAATATSSRVAKDGDSLKESIAWLKSCFEGIQKLRDQKSKPEAAGMASSDEASSSSPPPSPVTKSAQDVFMLSATQFLYNLASMTDIFGNALNLVTNPAVSLADADDEISSFALLEEVQARLAKELADGKAAVQQQSQTAKSISDALNTAMATEKRLTGQMDAAYAKYQDLRQQVIGKSGNVAAALEPFWESVKDDFKYHGDECGGWSGVMSSVSSVMMFTPAEGPGAVYGAGSALSIGASVWNAVDQMEAASREKAEKELQTNTLEARVHRIETGMRALTTADLLKVVREDDPSISDPQSADGLQSTILVEKQKWTDMCDRYFSSYIKADDIKDMFDDLMDTVQSLRVAIQTYTSLAVKYLQALKDESLAAASQAELMASNAALSNPALDLVYQFFVRSTSERFASALTSLFQGVRAYNCLAMQHSEALAKLAELESFDNISAPTLKAALDTLRSEIVHYLGHASSNPRSLFQGLAFSVTPATHPSVFQDFKQHGSLALFLRLQDRTKYGMPSHWYDIRLQGVRVHLKGAKSPSGSFITQLTVGPRFQVMDESFAEHTFGFPSSRTTSLSYRVDAADGSVHETSSSQPVYETDFQFSVGGRTPQNIPLATPFTSWKLSIDPSAQIDLSGLTEIDIEMDVFARTSLATPATGN